MDRLKVLYSDRLWYFLVISSYLFGIACIQFEMLPSLVEGTWFQMMLSFGALYFTYPSVKYKDWWTYVAIAWLVGFFIEVAGVNTKMIFGEYWYGSALGVKLWGTPLAIGINWFLICYVVNQVVNHLLKKRMVNAILAATIITAIDYLIEPDAIEHKMWMWKDDIVPLKNYIGWWLSSLGLSLVYNKLDITYQKTSYLILGLMILFFLF